MSAPEPYQGSCKQQLDELLGIPEFLKIIELVTREVMGTLGVPRKVARGFVLSAIGEPQTLASIHSAWCLARANHDGFGLAKVIVRRRVIDLLRKDTGPVRHCSLPGTDVLESNAPHDSFHDVVRDNPRTQLELREVIRMVREALACFASQGQAQRRQAHLLSRYALDETDYADLSTELATSPSALRVRVHTAMLALRRHVHECHSDLVQLLEGKPS